jgi:FtsZ-interacting cell division protein ZipA
VTITSYPENPTPSDAKSHDNEDWMNKMSAKVESLGRTLEEQAQQREEKRAKRLKELQEDIDQFRKNQKSKNPEPEPVNKTGATVTQEQNDSKSGSSGLTVDNNTGTVVTGVTAQSGPPPPLVGTLNTARANIQPDPAPKSPLTPTPQPPTSPPMAGGAKEGQIDSKNELSGSLTNTTRSTEDNRPAAILPVTQSDDRMLLYVAAGSVLIATEPWWRPKVEAFLNRTFAKLMPTHPTPTPEATPFPVQKETRLYDTPTIRRDNIF